MVTAVPFLYYAFFTAYITTDKDKIYVYCTAALVGTLIFRFIFGALCKKFFINNAFSFAETLEHELTHAVFGYLTFSPPTSLKATLGSGGEVKLKHYNILAVLSPYFFPLGSYISLGLGYFIKPGLQHYWNAFTFILLGNFLYRLMLELRLYQPDLKIYGRLFSISLILILLLFSMAAIAFFTGIMGWDWLFSAKNQVMGVLIDGFK